MGGAFSPDMGKLSSIQEKIVRVLLSRHDSGAPLEHMMKNLRLMKLSDLYRFYACLNMYRILNQNHMPTVHDELRALVMNHDHLTRNRRNFRIPVPRTRAVQLNYLYQSVSAWNDLPNNLRQLETLNEFRRKLKAYLFDTYID